MKNFRIFLFLALLSCMSIAVSSCGSNATTTESAAQGKEYTSAYICPMHCKDSGSEKMGTCPVCSMDYVKNEDHKGDGHSH